MVFTNDTQLHLVMSADNTAVGLSVTAVYTADVTQWYHRHGNVDKSRL